MNTPIRKPHYPLWLVLCIGLLFSYQAQAEMVARVLFAHGEVIAQRIGDAPRTLSRGDELFVQEIVQTGKNSSVQFRFTDGALIALRGESQFAIEQHRYDQQNPQQNEQAGQLLRGGLRAITGAIARERPEAVNMRTPVATIGIRGTVYETFYIPPEGHPALPGVAPGHYVLVLRGRVSISNPAGELILADGEIGYTPDADTPPALRPDLAGLFGQFAALDSADESLVIQSEDDPAEPGTADIENVLTESAITTGTVATGPFAFVVGDDGINIITSRFLSQAVQMDGGSLSSASSGSGDFQSVETIGSPTPLDPGSVTLGDSQVYWGVYQGNDVTIDGGSLPDYSISYITATNVLLNTSDLPTTGSHTYTYQGGSGDLLEGTSHLSVDFGSATMSAELSIASVDTWSTTTPQAISNFYSSGLTLTGAVGNGTLTGHFVGTNAEGAISYFILNENTETYVGTAAFAQ